MSNSLTLIEIKTPASVFVPNGLDYFLENIEKQARSFDRDISTARGRDSIRSLANDIAKSKNILDKMGKELGTEYREKISAINTERNRAVDRLQKLQDEMRKPLTEWEDAEDSRVKAHEEAIAAMTSLAVFGDFLTPTSAEITTRLQALPEKYQRDWQEFSDRSSKEHERVQDVLNKMLAERKRQEEEQADLARLRAEEERRLQKEREERIAAEAAAKAKAEAEEKAKIEADRQAKLAEQARQDVIRQKEESERKAKADAEAAAKREAEAKAALEKAEADKVSAAIKAEQDKKDAAEAAAKAERLRIAADQEKERKEAEAREADKAHRAKINNDALTALVKITDSTQITMDALKKIVVAIAKGEIPNVRISY